MTFNEDEREKFFVFEVISCKGETIRIQLKDEMIMLLLRGGIVNYVVGDIKIRIEQENPLVIIDRDKFIDLKRHMYEPSILEHIFREIDK